VEVQGIGGDRFGFFVGQDVGVGIGLRVKDMVVLFYTVWVDELFGSIGDRFYFICDLLLQL
jgi:hypothetical protein